MDNGLSPVNFMPISCFHDIIDKYNILAAKPFAILDKNWKLLIGITFGETPRRAFSSVSTYAWFLLLLHDENYCLFRLLYPLSLVSGRIFFLEL